MKPPRFEYFAPTSLGQAVELLAGSENARCLAGGQSLLPMLNLRYVVPDRLVDLNRIDELAGIAPAGADILIGSMTRQRTIEKSLLMQSQLPLFAKALRHIGHFQTRNRGTFGGSLCHLDPAAELPAVALTYDATLDIVGPAGPRMLPMTRFATSFMTTALEHGEILRGIRIAKPTGLVGTGFCEFARRHGDFAIAGAAALVVGDAGGVIREARLTLFGVAEKPVRVGTVEAMLIGQHGSADLVDAAATMCAGESKLDDRVYTAAYRGHVAVAMAKAALAEAIGELEMTGRA
jgi:carbon-monoxide dehydrogenase medium subunit